MGKLRRKTLTIAKGFLWAMVVCAGDPLGATQRFAVAGSVILLELAATGAFSVTNEGHDIELRRDVLIEKQDPSTSSWTKLDAHLRLVATCNEVETSDTRILRRGETLVVVP